MYSTAEFLVNKKLLQLYYYYRTHYRTITEGLQNLKGLIQFNNSLTCNHAFMLWKYYWAPEIAFLECVKML